MSIAFLFAILMVIWLFFGLLCVTVCPANRPYLIGSLLLIWILFALLGWALFGPLIHR